MVQTGSLDIDNGKDGDSNLQNIAVLFGIAVLQDASEHSLLLPCIFLFLTAGCSTSRAPGAGLLVDSSGGAFGTLKSVGTAFQTRLFFKLEFINWLSSKCSAQSAQLLHM